MGLAEGAGLLFAIGSAVYQNQQSRKAAHQAKKQGQQQIAQQQQLQEQARQRSESEDQTAIAQQARARQRALAAGASGRSDTIMTSPLGAPGAAPVQIKTALGA